MSSLRKIASCRLNGARSKGPVTEAGRLTASRNAMRHGLLAKAVLLSCENPAGFQALIEEHLASFEEPDGVEFGMIEDMVSALWRMRRAWTLEKRLFEEAYAVESKGEPTTRLTAGFRKLAASPELALLHRYETRLHLVYQRSFNNLIVMRNARVPNEPSPANEHSPEFQSDVSDASDSNPAGPESPSTPPTEASTAPAASAISAEPIIALCSPRASGLPVIQRRFSPSKRALRRANAKQRVANLAAVAPPSASSTFARATRGGMIA